MSFTPGEDALLLRGLQLFGESAFDRVQKQLLPAKSKELLMFRVQTLAKAADGNGVARFRSRRARRPKGSTKWQSYDDRVLALGATGYAREWTAIQQELLPHRQTSDMRKRWKKIEAAWAPKLAELKASGADLKAKAAEARLVRDRAAKVAAVAGRVVETLRGVAGKAIFALPLDPEKNALGAWFSGHVVDAATGRQFQVVGTEEPCPAGCLCAKVDLFSLTFTDPRLRRRATALVEATGGDYLRLAPADAAGCAFEADSLIAERARADALLAKFFPRLLADATARGTEVLLNVGAVACAQLLFSEIPS